MSARVLRSVALCLPLVACGEKFPAAPPPPPLPATTATATVSASAAPPAKAPPRADASLLARKVLFDNPDRASPRYSPDGKRIAYLAAVDGVLNVWVAPAGDLGAAKPVTQDKKRGIREFHWAKTGVHLLYLLDKDGDENNHVYAVDLQSGETKDLTPQAGAKAHIDMLSSKVPGEVLVGINDRDPKWHDLHRVDLRTGKRTLVQKNEGMAGFVADDSFKIRYAVKPTSEGGSELLEPDGKGAWKVVGKVGLEDALTTHAVGLDATGRTLFMLDSRGRDTGALLAMDTRTGKTKVLAEDAQADVTGAVEHPVTHEPQAATSAYDRVRWHVIDKSIAPDLEALGKIEAGDLDIVSRTDDDKKWIVAFSVSDGPTRYYAWTRQAKKADFLFTNIKALEGAKLSKMQPVIVKARDGASLVSYLTRPLGAESKPSPMVLLVHGGPWARDHYGLNRTHQWLASRGYAVLSVNYRGSTGFGKRFVNMGNGEWAGKMHDDLLDAVSWAVAEHVTERDKVAIMGGSYGGYATLVGLTFTPETFACGVDIVGPSNLVTLLNTIPPYWAAGIEQFTKRIGDHRTEDGRRLLEERSPLGRAGSIVRPLLIGQGKNDPRVKQAESDQLVKAMQGKKIPVTYVLYPDEGHGFARPENRMSFNAVAEIFLAQCLGGPYQPIGDDFRGSSIEVPAGADGIHSLPEALTRH